MYHSQINIRYARSLYLLAEEKGLVDEIKQDIEMILQWLSEIKEIEILLEHPVIKASKKAAVLNSFFEDKVNNYTLSFLQMIVNKKRENHLKNICFDFVDLCKKGKGIKTAVLTTAFELSRTHQTNIKRSVEKVFNTEVELDTKVNESIIGGMVIQLDDQQLDLSVSRQIQRLRDQLRSIDFNNK